MNKQIIKTLFVASLLPFSANADMLLGGNAGIDLWFADAKINDVRADDLTVQPSLYASVEHFIPLIPNAKVRYTGIESAKFNTDFTQYDFIAYYEILDNDLLSFDIGLNLQQYSGTFKNQQFDEWQPNLYANGAIGIPTLPLTVFASFSVGEFDGTKTTDAEAGVTFSLNLVALDIDIRAGYRMIDYDFDYFNEKSRFVNDGFFLGLGIDI